MSKVLQVGSGNWAIKNKSFLGYNSENGNYKPMPFSFSRLGSGTFVGKNGFIQVAKNQEVRIDFTHSPDGALLIEPQSTNYIKSSNNFLDNITYSKGFYTILTESYAVSPDGKINATRVQMPDGNGTFFDTYVYETLPAATFSFYAKNNGGSNQIKVFTPEGINTKETITLTDDWKRYVFVGNSGSQFKVGFDNVTGAGETDFLIYGFQLENQEFASSYIPTNADAYVTRAVEKFAGDLSRTNVFPNQNTIVLQFIAAGFTGNYKELIRFTNSFGFGDELALEGFNGNRYDVYGTNLQTSGMMVGSLEANVGEIHTFSFSYSNDNLLFSHNGNTINVNTPQGYLPTIDRIEHEVGALSSIQILKLDVFNDFKTQEKINSLTKQ